LNLLYSASLAVWFVQSAGAGKGLTVAAGKSLTVNNTLTLAGTDGQTFTFPATSGNVFASSLAVPQANVFNGVTNFNTSSQSQLTVAGTAYYITGSGITVPASPLTGTNGMTANKTTFLWDVAMNKDANGTGAFSIIIYRGTTGTTADTADVTQALAASSTNVADQMTLEVQLTITTVGGTGAYYWSIVPTHLAGAGAGFGLSIGASGHFSGTVSSVNLSTASLIFGLGFKAASGGTQPTIGVPQVQSTSYYLA
jgi:hypothetical protein